MIALSPRPPPPPMIALRPLRPPPPIMPPPVPASAERLLKNDPRFPRPFRIASRRFVRFDDLQTAWADGNVSTRALARNWGVAFIANAIGAYALALAIYHSGVLDIGNSYETAVKIAEAKAKLSFKEAFLRGLLCNFLVCLAVWLSFGGYSVTDKILAIVLPGAALVALGFEHSIANCYLIRSA